MLFFYLKLLCVSFLLPPRAVPKRSPGGDEAIEVILLRLGEDEGQGVWYWSRSCSKAEGAVCWNQGLTNNQKEHETWWIPGQETPIGQRMPQRRTLPFSLCISSSRHNQNTTITWQLYGPATQRLPNQLQLPTRTSWRATRSSTRPGQANTLQQTTNARTNSPLANYMHVHTHLLDSNALAAR